jgi:predicted O-linked N-acetylglucosamine transferase (SPINDLY family)
VPSPYLASGGITIGTPASLFKVNRRTLDFWCDVLQRLPAARLRLAFGPQPPGALERIRRHLSGRRIASQRYDLIEQGDASFYCYLNTLDLALDSFPFGANFTAYQAISQGVPIVTIRGDRYPGRLAAGLLNAIGREEWVAGDAASAVEIACALANNPQRLAEERTRLPELLQRSGVLDAAAYARAMEGAYEAIFADCLARAGLQ